MKRRSAERVWLWLKTPTRRWLLGRRTWIWKQWEFEFEFRNLSSLSRFRVRFSRNLGKNIEIWNKTHIGCWLSHISVELLLGVLKLFCQLSSRSILDNDRIGDAWRFSHDVRNHVSETNSVSSERLHLRRHVLLNVSIDFEVNLLARVLASDCRGNLSAKIMFF